MHKIILIELYSSISPDSWIELHSKPHKKLIIAATTTTTIHGNFVV